MSSSIRESCSSVGAAEMPPLLVCAEAPPRCGVLPLVRLPLLLLVLAVLAIIL
jgi:hypothetical protein